MTLREPTLVTSVKEMAFLLHLILRRLAPFKKERDLHWSKGESTLPYPAKGPTLKENITKFLLWKSKYNQMFRYCDSKDPGPSHRYSQFDCVVYAMPAL